MTPIAAGGQQRDRPEPRDRDAAGRPRNARPRDALGRPLARTAAGEPVSDENLRLTPREALLLAQELIDSGRPFHAHEVLEAAGKAAPTAERGAWKGLAQLAVGLTHARRANAAGAVALLRRGAEAVGAFGVSALIDTARICEAAQTLADRIERDGLASVPPDEVTLRLAPLLAGLS